LQSTINGVPLEIYVLQAIKDGERREYVMSDVLLIIASVPYFWIEVFELPSKVSIIILNC
jgi:hypothetical protein